MKKEATCYFQVFQSVNCILRRLALVSFQTVKFFSPYFFAFNQIL